MNEIERSRLSERNHIIESISSLLKGDQRVVAAWLVGSIGRGSADAWSDVDVWIVVRDRDFVSLVANRYTEVSRVGEVILTVEAPQNGPPAGTYLMSGYDFPSGIQLVDWYWQPLSAAKHPKNGAILVMKEPIPDGEPSSVEPYITWHPQGEEDAANSASLAWAMIAIQAKYLVRGTDEGGMRFHAFIEDLLGKATYRLLSYGDPQALPTTDDKLTRIEQMAADLRSLAPRSSRPANAVARYLSTVRSASSGRED